MIDLDKRNAIFLLHQHQEEQRLRALHQCVAEYLDFAFSAPGMVQRHRFTRELFSLSRRVTSGVFVQAIRRAHRYRVIDLSTIRRITWLCISQAEDILPHAEVDEEFQQRPAYQEGCLTDLPDLSVYDLHEDKQREPGQRDPREVETSEARESSLAQPLEMHRPLEVPEPPESPEEREAADDIPF